MSAIFGGANAIMINSYNSTFENSTEFSERIARNQQTILKKESYLDKVIDPTNGSYYINYLIAELLSDFEIKSNNKKLPIMISPKQIKSINYLEQTTSAQVKSAILFAALGCDDYSSISFNKYSTFPF